MVSLEVLGQGRFVVLMKTQEVFSLCGAEVWPHIYLLYITAVSSTSLNSRADVSARPLAYEFDAIGNKIITL